MTKEEALKIILDDISQAKKAKKDIDTNIGSWLSEYEGEPYGVEKTGKSKMVVKDIKKAVEWFIPNAVEPFVNKNRIVKLDGITAEDVNASKMHERLLNYQFVRKFDRYSFIHDMFKVGSTEGTTIVRCGWDTEEKETSETFEGVTAQQLAMFEQEGFELSDIEETSPGIYSANAKLVKTIKNQPTAEVVRNGNVYPDPTSTSVEDASFVAYKYESTVGELKASGKYSEEDIQGWLFQITDRDSTLETERDTRNREYGYDPDYTSLSEASRKVTVYEYWGNLDMDDDGIAEPKFATIVDDKLLEIVDNPYPDQSIPFVEIQFSRKPFAFWGSPLAEFISDNQKIRSSLMRGFIDNVAQSNNNTKFVKKGALDLINKRKLENNLGGVVEINGDSTDIFDGNFNPIQPTIFSLYELVQSEAEALSGITRYSQGLDSSSLNKTATGVATISSMSQKRMMEIIRRYSEGLKKVFRKWISYNKEFLSDEEVMRINGQFIPFKRDDIDGAFDIDITVGVDGVSENKVNQMTMLMQQVGGLAGTANIPPQFFNMMLAKMADEWGYPDVAQMLEEAPAPEPNEFEMRMAQAELDETESKTQLNEAKAIKAMSDSNATNVESKKSAYGITSEEKRMERSNVR